jgi:hypothetical protein
MIKYSYMKQVFPMFLKPGGGPLFLAAELLIDTVEDCIEKLL